MHIALLASSFLPAVGGLEWKVHHLATEYVRAGHRVKVFAPRPGRDCRGAEMPPVGGYEVVPCGFSGRGMGRLGIVPWLMRRAVRRTHCAAPIDVVHCHPLGVPSQVGVEAGLGGNTVVVATTSGNDVAWQTDEGVEERLPPHLHEWVRGSAARLDAIVAVSRSMRAAIQALDVNTRIVDIPNGVAWDDFQGDRSRWLQDKLGIPYDAPIVLSVGRCIPSKNYRRAMAAFNLARQTTPHARFVIVGRGVPTLADTVEARALGASLSLLDQQPMAHLPAIFHSADVFFNASLTEGFAQVNVQALASGLPLVITDAPGNVDAGDHGGALIARAHDPVDMSQKLTELIASRARREELARAAHAAGRHYSWRTIAQSYLSLFDELLKARRAAGMAEQ